MSNKIAYLLLAMVILFCIVNNAVIIAKDTTPFFWDGGGYFHKSILYYDVITHPGPDFFSRLNAVSTYRPPLFLLTSQPLYALFGRTPDVAAMTNIIYLVILSLSVYGIGTRLQDNRTGVLASFLTLTFPLILGLSRSYWLDFPVTAMVSLSIYLLLRTDNFSSRKYSLLFGLSLGLGMLTKWTHFVFVAGPFIYTAAASARHNDRRSSVLANAALSVALGIAAASFWYIPNGMNVAKKLLGLSVGMTDREATRFQELGETIGPSGIFTIKSFAFYAGKLVNEQISFFYAAVFAACFVPALRRARPSARWNLTLWILLPVIAFTLIKNKTDRNTVPMLPAVALVIAMAMSVVISDRFRKLLVTALLVVSLLQYTASSYRLAFLPRKIAVNLPIGEMILFQEHENHSYALYSARTYDWPTEDILNTIDTSRNGNSGVSIMLMTRDPFTWKTLDYSSLLKGLPFSFTAAVDNPDAILESDYVIVKRGGFIAPWFAMDNIYRARDLMHSRLDDFDLLQTVPVPEEQYFLPIYDIKETASRRSSGVVFSDTLQVMEYSLIQEDTSFGSRITVEMTLKAINNIDTATQPVFKLMDKKMAFLMLARPASGKPLAGLSAGQKRMVTVSFTVPREIAKQMFSIEMGFGDPVLKTQLSYRPEYLIYRRTG